MTIVKYYTDLFATGSVGAYIAIGAVLVVALFAFLQALIDFGRGTSRSLMRLITVAGAAVLAFFATPIVGRAFFADQTVASVLPFRLEQLDPIMNASLSEVLLPIVFVALFLAFSSVLVIVHKLLCGILGFSYKRNNVLTRLFGMVVGVLHGALTAVIVLFPLFVCMGLYADAAAAPDAKASVVAFYEDYIEPTVESPLYEYPMQYGGNYVQDELAKAKKSN